MAKHEVVLESLGEGVTEAYVAGWLKNVGDEVKAGEDIVEMMTDKVNVVIQAEASGTVTEILYPLEARVQTGSVIAIIED